MLSLEPVERPRESCKYSTWSLPFSLCCHDDHAPSADQIRLIPAVRTPRAHHQFCHCLAIFHFKPKRNHRLRQPQQYKMVSETNAPALPTTCRANCALYQCAVLLRFRNRCSSHSCPWTFSSSIHYRWAWCLCLCGRVRRNTTAIVPCTQSFRTLVELVCTFKCSFDFQALIFVFSILPTSAKQSTHTHTHVFPGVTRVFLWKGVWVATRVLRLGKSRSGWLCYASKSHSSKYVMLVSR